MELLSTYLNESTGWFNYFYSPRHQHSENPFNGFDVGDNAAPTFTDVDEDGDLDLVVGGKDGTLKYYLNESTTNSITFTPKTSTENPFNGLYMGDNITPSFIDIDGDGDLDLVSGEYIGKIFITINHFGTWATFQ